jgi:hypothetical protein
MEIEKLMVKQELKGYYFYFTKLNKNNYQNINYTMEKSLDNSGNNLIKVKKYRCLFDSNEAKNNNNATILRNKINQNQMFQSLIMYPTNIRINNFRKKERKKSIDKNSKVSFKEEEDYLLNNFSTLKAKNWDTKIDDNSNVITGDFVPNFTIHFSINLKNLTFVKVKENEQSINYVEILKKEANNKIRILQEKLKYLTKKTKSNKYTYDSEEYEGAFASGYVGYKFQQPRDSARPEQVRLHYQGRLQDVLHKRRRGDARELSEGLQEVSRGKWSRCFPRRA